MLKRLRKISGRACIGVSTCRERTSCKCYGELALQLSNREYLCWRILCDLEDAKMAQKLAESVAAASDNHDSFSVGFDSDFAGFKDGHTQECPAMDGVDI